MTEILISLVIGISVALPCFLYLQWQEIKCFFGFHEEGEKNVGIGHRGVYWWSTRCVHCHDVVNTGFIFDNEVGSEDGY